MDGMNLLRARPGLMAKVARELGLSRAAVTKWERIPDNRLSRVTEITGIPAALLRPDLAEVFKVEGSN